MGTWKKPRQTCDAPWKFSPLPARRIKIWEFFYRGETGLRKLPLNCFAQPNWFPAMLPFTTIEAAYYKKRVKRMRQLPS